MWAAAITLASLLTAGSCWPQDQNQFPQLAEIINQLLNRFTPRYGRRAPMFSLAVSVPYNRQSGTFDPGAIGDLAEAVTDTILRCEVYSSRSLVAATVLRWPNVLEQCPDQPVQWPDVLRSCPEGVRTWADVQRHCPSSIAEGRADHAEYRVLQSFDSLVTNPNHLLVFYVLSSPCGRRCTSTSSRWSILTSIQRIQAWQNYSVVFSQIFQPRSGVIIPRDERRAALQRLGGSVGLRNIFRCDRGSSGMSCRCCSTNNQVADVCYDDPGAPVAGEGQLGGAGQVVGGGQLGGGSQVVRGGRLGRVRSSGRRGWRGGRRFH